VKTDCIPLFVIGIFSGIWSLAIGICFDIRIYLVFGFCYLVFSPF